MYEDTKCGRPQASSTIQPLSLSETVVAICPKESRLPSQFSSVGFWRAILRFQNVGGCGPSRSSIHPISLSCAPGSGQAGVSGGNAMSWVPLVPDDQASPAVKRMYDYIRERWGFVPNYFYALGRDAQLLQDQMNLFTNA